MLMTVSRVILLATLTILLAAEVTGAEGRGTTVLLTFDTELDPDADALERLDLDMPASFFFTGAYALEHAQLLRRLAEAGNTIGSHSHSHPDLTTLDAVQIDMEARLSKSVLDGITGGNVRWFRAPYLKYDDDVMQIVRNNGFDLDSSDISAWPHNEMLPELAISSHAGTLASDYDLFVSEDMTDAAALDWLGQAYDAYAEAGRPFVMLSHPRIIAEHAHVLHAFVDYVRRTGGTFATLDAWTAEIQEPVQAPIVGLWVDLSFEEVDPETLVSDAMSLGVTDVFLSILDPAGIDYISTDDGGSSNGKAGLIIERIQQAGMKAHAWIAVNSNSALAGEHPELAMVSDNGQRSDQWISPSNETARAFILGEVRSILGAYHFDGLHLDYIRYPGLAYDFSDSALARFSSATGIEVRDVGQLQTDDYVAWTDWRSEEISGLVEDIRRVAVEVAGPDIELSAALIGNAAVNYRSREDYGQDYGLLARHLDLILPMAYYPLEGRDPSWVERTLYATRWQVGDTRVATGLASFNQPDDWEVGAEDMREAMSYALSYTDGVSFYPYSGLFGRRDAVSSVGADVLDAVHAALALRAVSKGMIGAFPVKASSVLGGAAVFLAVAGLVLAATGRRRAASLPRMMTEDQTREVLAVPWRMDARKCQTGTIDGETCMRVSRLLRRTKPEGLERARQLVLLNHLECKSTSGHCSRADLDRIGLSQPLKQAMQAGLVEDAGRGLTPTAAGRNEIRSAREAGFDLDYGSFLLERMNETLSAECMICGADNAFHFFWPSFECKECGNLCSVEECENIRIYLPSDSFRNEAIEDVGRSYAHA